MFWLVIFFCDATGDDGEVRGGGRGQRQMCIRGGKGGRGGAMLYNYKKFSTQ